MCLRSPFGYYASLRPDCAAQVVRASHEGDFGAPVGMVVAVLLDEAASLEVPLDAAELNAAYARAKVRSRTPSNWLTSSVCGRFPPDIFSFDPIRSLVLSTSTWIVNVRLGASRQ